MVGLFDISEGMYVTANSLRLLLLIVQTNELRDGVLGRCLHVPLFQLLLQVDDCFTKLFDVLLMLHLQRRKRLEMLLV